MKNKGFTLIEITIATLILSIIAISTNLAFENINDLLIQSSEDRKSFGISNDLMNELEKELHKLPPDAFKKINFERKRANKIDEKVEIFGEKNEENKLYINKLYNEEIESLKKELDSLENEEEIESVEEEINQEEIRRKISVNDYDGNNLIKEIRIEIYFKGEKLIDKNQLITHRKHKPMNGKITGEIHTSQEDLRLSIVDTLNSKETEENNFEFNNITIRPKKTKYYLKAEGINQRQNMEVYEIEFKTEKIKEMIANDGRGKVEYNLSNKISPNYIELEKKEINKNKTTETIYLDEIANEKEIEIKFPQRIEYELNIGEVEEETSIELKDADGNVKRRLKNFKNLSPQESEGVFHTNQKGIWKIEIKGETSEIDGKITYKIGDGSTPYAFFSPTFNVGQKELETHINTRDYYEGIKKIDIAFSDSSETSIEEFDYTIDRNDKKNWGTNENFVVIINEKEISILYQDNKTEIDNNFGKYEPIYIHLKLENFENQKKEWVEGPFIIR